MFKEILVPVDRSTSAESAIAHAASISRVFDSNITVLHVMESSRAMVPALANPIDWQINRVEVETYLQQHVDHVQAGGIHAGYLAVEGDPATRIREHIRDHDIDLVVLSAHGQTNSAEWQLGSVAQKIVNTAQTSLLIVRPSSTLNEPSGAEAKDEVAYHKDHAAA